MSKKEIWAVSENGTIQYRLLTSKYLEGALDVIKKALFTEGNINKALGIPNDPEALAELDQVPRAAAKDGVTVIAVDKNTDNVVGVAFNKLLVKADSFYENFAKSFKNSRSLQIIDYILRFENKCNIFDYCQVDSSMEISFLGTLSEYRKQGIAKKLCEISVEVAQNLLDGVNVKQSVNGQELSLEPAPKIVSAIFSSFISQKIGRELGFEIAAEVSNNKIQYQGSNLGDLIEKDTASVTMEYKRLNKKN